MIQSKSFLALNKVVIIGSSGSIGSYLKGHFENNSNYTVLALSRQDGLDLLDDSDLGIFSDEDFFKFAKGAIVINCAAYNGDGSLRDAEQIDKINFYGTLNLIRQCNNAGVSRFYQISSYKALGESCSSSGFNIDAFDKPESAYGKSKSKLDRYALGLKLEMDLIILRLPVVYGGSTGESLLKLCKLAGFPIPVTCFPVKRDYLSLNNLGKFLDYLFSQSVVTRLIYLQDRNALTNFRLLDIISEVENRAFRKIFVPESIIKFLINLPLIGVFFKKINGNFYLSFDDRLSVDGISESDISLRV